MLYCIQDVRQESKIKTKNGENKMETMFEFLKIIIIGLPSMFVFVFVCVLCGLLK